MADEALTITFIVEDGTCVSDANSYITLEDANQYQTNKNRSEWLALSDDEKMASLIKGTQYVDKLYRWKGVRKFETQVLSFPRVGKNRRDWLYDLDGFPIKNIPRQIKDAVCEAAFYGYKATTELFTIHESESGGVKRDKKVVTGAVEKEIEYFSSNEATADYISRYAALDSLLRGLYFEKGKYEIVAKADWGF
mgnify:CR=1 FL=1